MVIKIWSISEGQFGYDQSLEDPLEIKRSEKKKFEVSSKTFLKTLLSDGSSNKSFKSPRKITLLLLRFKSIYSLIYKKNKKNIIYIF